MKKGTHQEQRAQRAAFGEQVGDGDAGVAVGRHRRERSVTEVGSNAAHDGANLLRVAAADGEEPHRFRQHLHQQQRQRDRQDAADVEHRPPAPDRNERPSHKACQHRAAAHADEDQRHEDRLQTLGRVLGCERDDVRHRAA